MKQTAYIFILLCLLPLATIAQDIAALQKDAERLEPSSQEEAFKRYQEILRLQPVNLNALCKSSELCSAIGHRQASKTAQVNYFNAARRFAEAALRIAPANSEANFAMSFAMGRISLISSGRDKIVAVHEIKRYAELSIKADPANYKPYHVLGKWHYEVSNLNAFERALARLLYGGLPPASLQESIAFYEKSRSLNPGFTLNYLELARAYHRNDQNAIAFDMLNKLNALPNKTQDDPRVKEEGKRLMKELGR